VQRGSVSPIGMIAALSEIRFRRPDLNHHQNRNLNWRAKFPVRSSKLLTPIGEKLK